MSAADVRRELLGIASEAPPNPYAFPRTYVVRAVHSDGRMDLDPLPDAAGELRTLPNVEQWTMGGALSFPDPGTAVLVQFRDARGERPVVIGIAPSAPGKDAARVDDLVVRFWHDDIGGGFYYSASDSAPFTWFGMPHHNSPPTPADDGTAFRISTGSPKIKVGP